MQFVLPARAYVQVYATFHSDSTLNLPFITNLIYLHFTANPHLYFQILVLLLAYVQIPLARLLSTTIT